MFQKVMGLVALGACSAVLMADGSNKPGAFDWPQWQGPDRNAISRETGLLKKWPKEGPRLVWKAEKLGGGYSAPSISAGRIFGMSFREQDEVVWALDEATGKELWSTRIAEAKRAPGPNGPEGSRGTPTIDGDVLFTLGENGDLVCLETASGKERWHKNLISDFGGTIPRWGYSESPLVDGDKVIVTPGAKDATLVALDKKTGETIWKDKFPEGGSAHYSSVIVADVDGEREYVQFLQKAVVGVSAKDGKPLWHFDQPANGISNISTPIYSDHSVFAASAYGKGGALAKIGNGSQAEVIYATKNMKNHHGGMVVVGGYLYGANGGNGETPALVCLDFKTGKVMWEERKAGKGSLAYADGCLYYRDENGSMLLVEANPKEYVELSRFNQPERTKAKAWSHPVIANGKLYLRDQNVLFCYDIKQHNGARD
jgi:outer membrane protein assembly factor BamB